MKDPCNPLEPLTRRDIVSSEQLARAHHAWRAARRFQVRPSRMARITRGMAFVLGILLGALAITSALVMGAWPLISGLGL